MSKTIIILSFVVSQLLWFSVLQAQTVNLDEDATEKTSTKKTSTQTKKKIKVDQQKTSEKIDNLSADALYQKQINQIEAQVNELKQEIFMSRRRLTMLKESILASGLQGTELHLVHRNELGSNFKLERILYIVDGKTIRQTTNQDGKLDQEEEIDIINGPIVAGKHELQVELVYRGNGYGVFSYLQEYSSTLSKLDVFRAEEGKRIKVTVVAYEKGGVTVDLLKRPTIRIDKEYINLDQDDASKN